MDSSIARPQRKDILAALKPKLMEKDIVVAALAGTTADCFQVMDRPGNLYLVGMGMVSQVALGLALALPGWRVIALDTDGSMLMSPSILPVIAARKPENFYALIFDNEQLFGSHGGPKSQSATDADIAGMARASGCERVGTLRDPASLAAMVGEFFAAKGPSLLVAKIEPSARGAGPKMDGQENKYRLVRYIEGTENKEILGEPRP